MDYTQGKIAALTGAGSGIGRALALQLNAGGCELYLSDINPETLAETAAALPRRDVAVHTRVLDVADRAAVQDWAQQAAAHSGHVDIVINNAGVGLLSWVEDDDYANLQWLMGVNFWGVVHGTQAFLPLLRQAEQGHVVNISSVFGLIGVPTQSAYNAAKFAVRGYTEAMRQEMAGSNIHVCCVHPGGIRTNIARDARGGDPAQTAQERSRDFQRLARTSPESAARQILRAIEKRKKRLLIGPDARIISLLVRLFPTAYTRFIPRPQRPGPVPQP
ncbi:MAG: short-chain dehydrogenase [Halioglobus sp.]|nr:short-chain dehydrogenase [Halioglobus sp.]|tara:strand:- start:383 stop:1207 length:825 start_codon:yes stop_codon:yes gene_type:complete